MNQVEEVKKMVRSVLVSSPIAATVSSVNRDYKELVGFDIPSREMGYNSLLHFLHSIPDVVKVNGTSYQSEVTLVVSEKTAHVNDLVMRQRKPSKSKRPTRKRRSMSYTPVMRMNNRISKAQNRSSLPASNLQNQFPFSEVAQHNGSPFSRSTLQNRSPFSGLTQQNESPFSRLTLQNRSPFSGSMLQNRSQFSGSMIQNQAGSTIPQSFSPLPKQVFTTIKKFSPTVHNSSQTKPQDILKEVYKRNNLHQNKTEITNPVDSLEQIQREYDEKKTNIGKNGNESWDSLEQIKKRMSRLSLLQSKQKIFSRIHSSGNNNNFTVTFRNDDYQGGNDKPLGLMSIKKELDTKIPSEIKQNLQILIRQNSSGLLCSELPTKYEEMFGKELIYQNYGFSNLITMCLASDVFFCTKVSSYDFKLLDGNQVNLELDASSEDGQIIKKIVPSGKEVDPFSIHSITSSDWSEYLELIPEGVLKLGERVENNMFEQFILGETLPIVISEVYSPDRFWIYKDDGKLSDMMNSLQQFYGENKVSYLVPEFLLENGLYCVVFLNEFYRGLVIDLLPYIGGLVRVYFIDYGTLVNLPRDRIWFLSLEFSKLPAQAIRAELFNIRPITGVWSKQSVQRYREFISSKYVFAKVAKTEDKVIAVQVSDRKKPLLFLNDVLVEEGYAEYIVKESLDVSIEQVKKVEGRLKLLERIRMKNKELTRK